MEKTTSQLSAKMNPSLDKQSDPEKHADPPSNGYRPAESSSIGMGTVDSQIFSMNDIDPVLDAKMRLVNQVRQAPTLLYIKLSRLIAPCTDHG
jgi:hypothetical protein